MKNELKAGDCVELKSGGPKMTVVRVSGDHACCVWFSDTEVLCDAILHVDALVRRGD